MFLRLLFCCVFIFYVFETHTSKAAFSPPSLPNQIESTLINTYVKLPNRRYTANLSFTQIIFTMFLILFLSHSWLQLCIGVYYVPYTYNLNVFKKKRLPPQNTEWLHTMIPLTTAALFFCECEMYQFVSLGITLNPTPYIFQFLMMFHKFFFRVFRMMTIYFIFSNSISQPSCCLHSTKWNNLCIYKQFALGGSIPPHLVG